MSKILVAQGAVPTAGLEAVLARAVEEGAPEPSWVVVEDRVGQWIRTLGRLSAEERGRGVVAASSGSALVSAVRLGIGGALTLPPSLAGASAALHAAAAIRPTAPQPDAWLADLVAEVDEELTAVTWTHRSFWRCQLGEPAMAVLLDDLARALDVLPALLPWPALLVRPEAADAVAEHWPRIVDRHGQASEGLEVVRCGRRRGHCGVVTAAMEALTEAAAQEPVRDAAASGFPKPVHELPSGRRVGWWSPRGTAFETPDGDWVAIPDGVSDAGFRWRLAGPQQLERWVDDVVDDGAGGGGAAAALRIPGWITSAVAPGRPAGLLVERLAGVAARLAVPLWVPNMSSDSLPLLLRLPGALWVDGPVVPES